MMINHSFWRHLSVWIIHLYDCKRQHRVTLIFNKGILKHFQDYLEGKFAFFCRSAHQGQSWTANVQTWIQPTLKTRVVKDVHYLTANILIIARREAAVMNAHPETHKRNELFLVESVACLRSGLLWVLAAFPACLSPMPQSVALPFNKKHLNLNK